MSKNLKEQGFVSTIQQRTNHKDIQNCLFACFLSQEEPKKMDVKSIFLYGKIEEEVYVCQPPGFEDLDFPDRVYKVEKTLYDCIKLLELDDIIFGSTNKSLCIKFEKMMHKKFQMSFMGELIFFLGLQDEDGAEEDIHLYRSMIGSLMYLTSSRPDITFAVYACARYQVNPKVSHLHAVKRIFSSTTGGCQFLGSRLISWQCKKQTVVANYTIEAQYVAASSCCRENGIGVNAGDSKLMLIGINLLLLGKVNAARHKLTTAGEVNASRNKLTVAGKVNAARHKLTTAIES
ncbi:putative ribonuclease H-like domain-containing protein [Tanacetum coccineum]